MVVLTVFDMCFIQTEQMRSEVEVLEEREQSLQSHCLHELEELYDRLHVLQEELQMKTTQVVEQEEELTDQLHQLANLEHTSSKVLSMNRCCVDEIFLAGCVIG